MTNLDWLNELVPEVSQGIKEAIMVARGIDPEATYDGGKEIELVQADIYMQLTIMPEFSEGSLSIKYNLSSLKDFANRIYGKYDDERYDSGMPLIKRQKL